MFDWWRVVPDAERRRWILDPLVSVGPLRFGMTPDEVTEELDGLASRPQHYLQSRPSSMDRYVRTRGAYPELGLTLYYGLEERLRGVVVSALRGPQVLAEGMELVGRAPSVLEQWMTDRAACREPREEVEYFGGGVPASESLGVIVHVERAGDHLLTRPIFVPVECLSDEGSHFLPDEVWRIWG